VEQAILTIADTTSRPEREPVLHSSEYQTQQIGAGWLPWFLLGWNYSGFWAGWAHPRLAPMPVLSGKWKKRLFLLVRVNRNQVRASRNAAKESH
jgi:hypothetical protein